MSDALKRTAVKWGIGRYLYRLDSPWVPCEVKQWQGKNQWKKWLCSPWDKVKVTTYHKAETARDNGEIESAIEQINSCADLGALKNIFGAIYHNTRHIAEHVDVVAAKDERKAKLSKPLDENIPYEGAA